MSQSMEERALDVALDVALGRLHKLHAPTFARYDCGEIGFQMAFALLCCNIRSFGAEHPSANPLINYCLSISRAN